MKSLEKDNLLSRTELQELWKIGWNCDVENFGDGSNAFKYLGGYVCKGPISDTRILGVSNKGVTISVKDRNSGSTKTVTIESIEFVRRYLQHALPSGMHSIRYYGFLHPRSKAKLARIREQLGVRLRPKEPKPESTPDPMLCPRCRKPMELVAQLARAPPWERSIPSIWRRKQKVAA